MAKYVNTGVAVKRTEGSLDNTQRGAYTVMRNKVLLKMGNIFSQHAAVLIGLQACQLAMLKSQNEAPR
jgi:hypothetical protein